ncbi:MAG: hypothetical protein O7D86_03700 [Proteobacteria bacterium]|nr:hypothetical protein [Pseudomonadota bacterium]
MTILTSFSGAEFEVISGPPVADEEQEQVEKFIDFVQEAMQFCIVQSDIQATGCSLRYLSIDVHPFIDMGNLYDLAYINFDTILDLPENKKDIVKIQLPVIEEGVVRLVEAAKILGIPSSEPEDAILAFFRIRLRHKQLEESFDFSSIKTVIRGTEESLEKLKKKGLRPSKMGGVVDSPESIKSKVVWGLEEECPPGLPNPSLTLFA